ncbi:hypothetical protein ACOBQB_00310 [Streptomyces sp. G5(2025)]|uniref:hypothetical protein n=1 Tax=Streptomyces sp. G5(2025) TaxID=3406628 RepID=UPI003C15DD5C
MRAALEELARRAPVRVDIQADLLHQSSLGVGVLGGEELQHVATKAYDQDSRRIGFRRPGDVHLHLLEGGRAAVAFALLDVAHAIRENTEAREQRNRGTGCPD